MGRILEKKVARSAVCAAWIIALGACGGGGSCGAVMFPPIAAAPSPVPEIRLRLLASPRPCGARAVGHPPAPTPIPQATIVPSASVSGQCAAPHRIDPSTNAAFADRQGTLANEKDWVRAWIDETYLWFDEVSTTLLAQDYATPVSYFDVLKTPKLTASGKPKDRFHFTANTEQARALAQNGTEIGYGMQLAFIGASAPRDIRVAFTEPGSPAAQAAVARGDRLIEIDGIDVVNGTDVDALNAAIAPQRAGEQHSFKLRANDGTERTLTLASASITRDPVPTLNAFNIGGGKYVGYLLFNEHLATAEYWLTSTMELFRTIGITDLVIDMRYNGGGYLDIASELAYMVSSNAATQGKAFERLQYNSKNPFQLTPEQATMPFHGAALGYSVAPGYALPQLGLTRVTVLSGPDTCSASESVVNSLRGIGITVDLVGGGTCGKPYGFTPQDNCGTSYYAIQFQGVNDKGFGDYGDGFKPTCAVVDDFTHELGDPKEARLAVALHLLGGGVCPTPASASKTDIAMRKAEAERVPYLVRSPILENRLLRPGRQPG
ncbi:S41 family peptidase [Variovorax sp. WS11]|uniref:S41 family peptidase n=1 Tax=Variovorax sp. WS11 TaxID=1105204 RepID=UPI001EF1A4B6|nr:S41 family peptidase [Variovorax sp. WS11]